MCQYPPAALGRGTIRSCACARRAWRSRTGAGRGAPAACRRAPMLRGAGRRRRPPIATWLWRAAARATPSARARPDRLTPRRGGRDRARSRIRAARGLACSRGAPARSGRRARDCRPTAAGQILQRMTSDGAPGRGHLHGRSLQRLSEEPVDEQWLRRSVRCRIWPCGEPHARRSRHPPRQVPHCAVTAGERSRERRRHELAGYERVVVAQHRAPRCRETEGVERANRGLQ
jgi:hypothetical protein